jgi:hypothetical protein
MNSPNTASGRLRWLKRSLTWGGISLLTLVSLLALLLALPLTRGLLLAGLSGALCVGRLEELAVEMDLHPMLKWPLALGLLPAITLGLWWLLRARAVSQVLGALGVVLGILVALQVVLWALTRHFNFDAQGRPVVYLSFRRDGVHKSFHPGVDRVTGRAKQAISPERATWLSELMREPLREVDPAVETNWFDINSGEPNLWYVEVAPQRWQFFNRPLFHPQLQIEAQPITPELLTRWQAAHPRRP